MPISERLSGKVGDFIRSVRTSTAPEVQRVLESGDFLAFVTAWRLTGREKSYFVRGNDGADYRVIKDSSEPGALGPSWQNIYVTDTTRKGSPALMRYSTEGPKISIKVWDAKNGQFVCFENGKYFLQDSSENKTSMTKEEIIPFVKGLPLPGRRRVRAR